jgi:hypothetical protein
MGRGYTGLDCQSLPSTWSSQPLWLVNGKRFTTVVRSMVVFSNIWMNFLGKEGSSLWEFQWPSFVHITLRGGQEEISFLREVFMVLTWIHGSVYLWYSSFCFHVPTLWARNEEWRRHAFNQLHSAWISCPRRSTSSSSGTWSRSYSIS